MPVLGTLADAIVFFVSIACTLLMWMLVIRVVLSWFGVNPWTQGNQLVSLVYQTTDAMLAPLRRVPLRVGPLDLTPLLLIVILKYLPILLAEVLRLLIP